MQQNTRQATMIRHSHCGVVGALEVGFGGGVEAAREEEGGEGYGDADELRVGGLLDGGFEGGEDVTAFAFEQLVGFAGRFYGGGDGGYEALVTAVVAELQAGVVGDGLVQAVAVGAVDFQQAGVVDCVEGFNATGGDGQGGLFGEAVGPGREDGQGVQGLARGLGQLLVGD